jgi:magnesium transporter
MSVFPKFVRARKRKRRQDLKPPGTAPETLVADPSLPAPRLSVIGYSSGSNSYSCDHEERTDATIDDILEVRAKFKKVWINVDGLGDATIVQKIGEIFHLHKLALEDVLSVHQRPKVDHFADHIFIVVREPLILATSGPTKSHFETDQVSIFLGTDYVITFQERKGDCLGPVRDRIRKSRGKVCVLGPDYLVYSILDAVIDAYFPLLEDHGERLEELEDSAISHPTRKTMQEIHAARRELLLMRRAVWPAREAVGALVRDHTDLISDETRIYLRDAYDHLVQLIDMLENYRELGADLMDIYLSSMSHKLNEVMKVLTIIATIFIPLGFIASVFGMNFKYMPELDWKYGYPASLGVMLTVALFMLAWFWRRGWIGHGRFKE